MFKRSVMIGLVSAVAAAFLFLPHLLAELLAFLFIGIVPYSTITIPAWWLLVIDIILVWLSVRWLRNQFTLLASSKKRELKKRQLARTEVYRLSRKQDRRRARLARAEARAERRATQAVTEPTNA